MMGHMVAVEGLAEAGLSPFWAFVRRAHEDMTVIQIALRGGRWRLTVE